MNDSRILFARLVYFSFGRIFGILNKTNRYKGKYQAKEHYYTMAFFRKLFKSYYVTVKYKNPLLPEKQIKLKLNLADNSSQHYFNLKGLYEYEYVALLHNLMPNYNCFIDIGANLGIYAVTIAQANPSKKVIAVEALKSNYEILEENIKLNNLSNCHCLLKAVSNQRGTLRFYINPIHDGGGSLLESDTYRTGNVALDAREYRQKHPHLEYYQEVEAITVDELMTDSSVMKIDVEGSELDVLRSATRAFQNELCDVIVVEVLKDKTFHNVVKFMNAVNYECYKLGSLIPLTGTEEMDWFVFNIICVRKECDSYQDIVNIVTQG